MLSDVERLEDALLGFRAVAGRWPERLSELVDDLDRQGRALEFESIRRVGLLPGGDGELIARIEHSVSPDGKHEARIIHSRLVVDGDGQSLWSFESEIEGAAS
jgi:hypothetical protein